MLRQMPARQFFDWMAYSEIEPFDEVRADLRAAQIVWMLAELNRDRKKRATPWKIEDFLLKFGEAVAKKDVQTWQQQKAVWMLIAEAFVDTSKQRPG